MVTGHHRHNPLAGASDKISPDGFRLLTNPPKKKKKALKHDGHPPKINKRKIF